MLGNLHVIVFSIRYLWTLVSGFGPFHKAHRTYQLYCSHMFSIVYLNLVIMGTYLIFADVNWLISHISISWFMNYCGDQLFFSVYKQIVFFLFSFKSFWTKGFLEDTETLQGHHYLLWVYSYVNMQKETRCSVHERVLHIFNIFTEFCVCLDVLSDYLHEEI
jgi:hypothetical protein